ncbi:alpha/beta fold hydrolase [Lewinella cohaerens]|uniref:alpha/beta fold hydrolase n=1 Tax=Lewinella cohaerens TaxID=70995 RepID=UPI00036A5376|nr:alpha/beta fold hydrolase [Lewinella cohaerens]
MSTKTNQHLLLLHGALGTKDQFRSLKEKLSSEFQVHDLDFEGHGERASSEEFTMGLFTENVIAYLSAKKINKIHIFGYSMGGYVGLNVAQKHPSFVEKIITLGTKFAWTEATAAKEVRMLNPDKIEEKVPAFANKLASIHTINDWKEVVEKTASMMLRLGQGERLTEKNLEDIRHEILIGIGSKDNMVSIEESKESAEVLPNGNLRIIENFQHPIEKIDDEILSSIIVDFIKN